MKQKIYYREDTVDKVVQGDIIDFEEVQEEAITIKETLETKVNIVKEEIITSPIKEKMKIFLYEAEKELDKINNTEIGIKTYDGKNIPSIYGEWESTVKQEVDPEAVYNVVTYTQNNKEIIVSPQIEFKKEKKYLGILLGFETTNKIIKGYELRDLEAVAPIEFKDKLRDKRDLTDLLKGKIGSEEAIYNWYILDTYYHNSKSATRPIIKELAKRLKHTIIV